MPAKNVFVLGLDPHNRRVLEALPGADAYHFHELLDFEGAKRYRFDDVVRDAARILTDFGGPIDAIVGFWDFPVSSAVPILCERFGVPGPRLGSILKCEHKYWSRLEQREAVPEVCPRFQALDAHADDFASRVELDFPFWIKPVKGTASALAYRVRNRAELDDALAEIRAGIDTIADAFDELVDHAALLPEAVRGVSGSHCLLEGVLAGTQHTACGYVSAHDVSIYGVVDSLTHSDSSVFERLQYPSRLPRSVQDRIVDVARRAIEGIGLEDCAFNIEFFYDADAPPSDAHADIGLLEINPRISQSHGEIFGYVDGAADHQIMLDVALGERPDPPRDKGPYAIAAKWYHRRFENGFIERVPGPDEIRWVEAEIPGVRVKVMTRPGVNLADMPEQDPSAFDLAHLWIGADDEAELEEKYRRVVEGLDFGISEPRGARRRAGGGAR